MKPATGTVKWLDDCPVTDNPRLRIRCGRVVREYDVEHLPQQKCYRLWRLDPATFELVCRTIDTSWGYKM